MISLELNDIKDFMNKLLRSELFDHFLLSEASICGPITYQIDGHLNTSFFSEEELTLQNLKDLPAIPFSKVRNNCFELMKGKVVPQSFHFVFMLSPSNLANTLAHIKSSFQPNDISGVYINIRYQNQTLLCTTGISYQIFSLDRSLEQEWDLLIQKFLKTHGISFEILS